MSLELLDTHLDTEAYEEMEQAVAPLERDADMRAHVEKALDDMVHDAVSNYGVNEQHSTELLFALPDLDTVPATNRSGAVVTWDLPGTIEYRDQQFAVHYRIVGEIPGTTHEKHPELHQAIANTLDSMRKRQTRGHARTLLNEEYEAHERRSALTSVKNVKESLQSRIKDKSVNRSSREIARRCFDELQQLDPSSSRSILTVLEKYYSDVSIGVLFAGYGFDSTINWGLQRLDSIKGLAAIDTLREKMQSAQPTTEDIMRLTATATIKDGKETVGEIKAVFGSTQPYLTKLTELRTSEAQMQKIIENARTALFSEQQEALAYGERGAVDPQAVVAAIDRVESPQTPVDADVIADEVDEYDSNRVQEFIKRYIHDTLDDTAEYMSIIPDDTDTDALAGQATLLEYAKATTFEAPVRAIPTRKYAGEVVRLLGKDIPV